MNSKKIGAEATVEIGENKVVKKREPKTYRHPEIDKKLREERTKTEINLMKKAKKHGANVPEIENEDTSTIEMEKINGKALKEVVEEKNKLMAEYGENIARLHSTNIIHGDLTTSNAVLSSEEDLHLIDFGLAYSSERVEDKAVDIHLLKQVLESSHPEVAEKAWESFVKGYKEYEESEKVLEQLKEVEKRGRYK